MVFNIQRYSVHDGEGIRTIIFLKGCPLRCPWCSNPESQQTQQEILRKDSLCNRCSSNNAFECPKDPDFCPTNALEWVGKEMSVEEVIDEVKKDMVFYESSGGGVTLSGGEVLLQGAFALEIIKRLHRMGIATAIETSGHGSWELLDEMSDYLDEILYDLKIIDPKQFRKVIKGDGNLILRNFEKLLDKKANVIVRIPVIPTYTDTEENIDQIIGFLKKHQIHFAHLLPFHQYGSSKYKGLGRDYECEDLSPPSDERMQKLKARFEQEGIKIQIGG